MEERTSMRFAVRRALFTVAALLAVAGVHAHPMGYQGHQVGVLSKPGISRSGEPREQEVREERSIRRVLKTCRVSNKSLAADTFTRLHNLERNALFNKPLTWDNCLAERAQNWSTLMAKKACALPPKNNLFGYTVTNSPGNLGENILYTWYLKGKDKWTINRIMKFWTRQKAGYNFKTKTCYPSEYCGDYIQIIWKQASRFGCGIFACDLKYGTKSQFKVAVCQYDKQFYYDTPPY